MIIQPTGIYIHPNNNIYGFNNIILATKYYYVTTYDKATTILELGYFHSPDIPEDIKFEKGERIFETIEEFKKYIGDYQKEKYGEIFFIAENQLNNMSDQSFIFEVDLSQYIVNKNFSSNGIEYYVSAHQIPISVIKHGFLYTKERGAEPTTYQNLKNVLTQLNQEKRIECFKTKLDAWTVINEINERFAKTDDGSVRDFHSHMDFLRDKCNFDIQKHDQCFSIGQEKTDEEYMKEIREKTPQYIKDMMKELKELLSNFGDTENIRNFIYPIPKKKYLLFHGTSIYGIRKAIREGRLTSNGEIYSFDYNKVFFTSNPSCANNYGSTGNIHSKETEKRKNYVLLRVDLSNYDLFAYSQVCSQEAFVWGSVDVNDIKNIYLYEDDAFIKEMSKDEVLRLKY